MLASAEDVGGDEAGGIIGAPVGRENFFKIPKIRNGGQIALHFLNTKYATPCILRQSA